jgi:hypothetical protein
MNIGADIQTIQQRKDPHNQAIANALQKLGTSISDLQLSFNQVVEAAAGSAIIPIQILPIPYAPTVTPIVTSGVQTQVWTITVTGSCSFAAPYGGVPGQHFILKVTQGGAGNNVLSFSLPYGFALAAGDLQPSGEVGQSCIIEGYFVTATELLITNFQGSI